MSTIGSISLQSDENGLVTLQCDRCKSRFKLECDFLNNELDGEICCPVCGIHGELNSFWPEEIVDEVGKIVMMEAEEMLQKAFKGFNSKFIKVKSTPVKRVNRELVFPNKDYEMQKISLECCHKDIGLKPADITAGFYCPYCGRIVK